MKSVHPILVLFILLITGCAGSDYNPCNGEIVIIDSNPAPGSSSDAVAPVTSSQDDQPVDDVIPKQDHGSRDLFQTHGESLVWVSRILEIKDNPYGVAVILAAHAAVFMDQLKRKIASGSVPAWEFEEVQRCISLAEQQCYAINPETDEHGLRYMAWDYKCSADRRYCAILTTLNTRQQETTR